MVGRRAIKSVTHQPSVRIDGSVLLDVGSTIVRVKKVFRALSERGPLEEGSADSYCQEKIETNDRASSSFHIRPTFA